jgi:hypothetical protein
MPGKNQPPRTVKYHKSSLFGSEWLGKRLASKAVAALFRLIDDIVGS